MGKRRAVWFLVGLYFCLLCVYAVWSYSLTDPNLILSSWSPYWSFQQFMWQTFFLDAQLLSYSYEALMLALFGVYGSLIYLLFSSRKQFDARWGWKQVLSIVLLCSLPLLFSYNALSHDVFNYVFNAKMVVLYHANPHVQVALDFVRDPWTRFMHNTHTPAPYWYGWTGLTLVPYVMGLGKFTLTWFIFKCFSLVSLLALIATWYLWAHWRGKSLSVWLVLTVALNPLVLIEIVSNAHNDLWMMVPAVAAIGLVLHRKASWKALVGSFLLLLASVSIKYATLVLLPLWCLIVAVAWWKRLSKTGLSLWNFLQLYAPLIASILLFVPLLTERSKQFLPWYLVWSLVWLPLFTWRQSTTQSRRPIERVLNQLTMIWSSFLIGFSFSALFRYVPWLRSGEFLPQTLTQQSWILWGGGVSISLLIYLIALTLYVHSKPQITTTTEQSQ